MEEEKSTLKMMCPCGHDLLLYDHDNCSYYCEVCQVVNDEIEETGVNEEDIVGRGAIYQRKHTRHRPSQPLTTQSALDPRSDEFWSKIESHENALSEQNLDDGFGLGAVACKDYFEEVRRRYVMGLQVMIQHQSQKLVEEFKVTPLICGVIGPIWLRFVALCGIYAEDWAEKTIKDSEVLSQGREVKQTIGHEDEPRNIFGKSASMILVKSLRNTLPLLSTLAISFLACHVARVPVLPTDIARWALDERICYLSCYTEIGKQMGEGSHMCPVSLRKMFKPYSESISSQRLETLAASIADVIGLNLPPVNFYAIASRYLQQLSLPVDKILPQACRIQTWAMPPELYLSKDESKLPTRVYVMSVLMVAIRILYNINGFGVWEKSLSSISTNEKKGNESVNSSGVVAEAEFNAEALLKTLEAIYHKSFEHEEDLTACLERYRELVIVGSEEQKAQEKESKRIEKYWELYSAGKNVRHSEDDNRIKIPYKRKRSSEYSHQTNKSGNKEQASVENIMESAIRRLKIDMEENGFCYITPRVKLKRLDYLHYVSKQGKSSSDYVAHADYYILLRSCAKVAEVDVKIMHKGVLSFEKRLALLEETIEHCLHLNPPSMRCKHCNGGGNVAEEF